jgi:hypothetical protein
VGCRLIAQTHGKDSTMADPDTEKDVLVLDTPTTATDPAPAPARRMGIPAVIGGAIATVFGFGLAQVVQDGWPLQGIAALEVTVAEQAQLIAEQQAELAGLKIELEAVSVQAAPDPVLAERLDAVEAAIPAPYDDAALAARMTSIEDRLTAIEALPQDGSGASPAAMAAQAAALAALQEEVAALRDKSAPASDIAAAAAAAEARLAEAEARANELRAAAEADAAQAMTRAALRQIAVALEAGGPYATALAALDPTVVPVVLAEGAEAGLPTLSDLQAGFPDAARAALSASLQADMGEGWGDRLGSFLRSQTGARSLTPREGSDPDAVLSRAEAALAEGRIADSLTEVTGLPEVGQQAMAAWVAMAERHEAGAAALHALQAAVGGE